jgi:hypothetical protein
MIHRTGELIDFSSNGFVVLRNALCTSLLVVLVNGTDEPKRNDRRSRRIRPDQRVYWHFQFRGIGWTFVTPAESTMLVVRGAHLVKAIQTESPITDQC